MTTLKPCPCGKTPTKVSVIGESRSKRMYVSGNCCGEWHIEFRADYETDLARIKALAEKAWNEAPRG